MVLGIGSAKSEHHPKLTNGEIILEEFQPLWSRYLNVTDIDGRADRRLSRSNTALGVASRGKNGNAKMLELHQKETW